MKKRRSMLGRVAGGLMVALVLIGGLAVWLNAGTAGAQKMLFFRIASGAAGGTYFPMAGLLAQVISNPPGARSCAKGGNCGMEGLVAFAQSAHGSVANVHALDADQVESAFVQSDVTYWAFTGTGPFAGKKAFKKLCVLSSLYPEHVHVVAGRDRNIKSVYDLKGKRVGIGLPASGVLVGARLVLGAHGLAEKRDFMPEYVKSKTATELVRDGYLDAFIDVSGFPIAGVVEMADTSGMALVSVQGKERDALIAKAPFYSADVIPGNTYKGNPHPVETVSVSALWVSRANLPEGLHYGVVKGLYGNPQAPHLLNNGHAKGKNLTLETHQAGVPIPYCQGAARFYKEKGVYTAPAAP
ncbi:MAG: immunogenic protein [Rhodospirillales bacterium CG15_BIG_FIL_POST_REV_8_21_14_020_66_15]|nr:MAG: immunogenic protein [Rhodospirillales bacterium CG15_BIG_FIL_POST_REV_8_21_14_020_66_15]